MPEQVCSCYLAGGESLLIHCAEAWLDRGHAIHGVVTATPQLVSWAEGRGISVIAPGKDLAERLTEPFDFFFSITNLSVTPGEVIAKARKAAINFHDGPLPRYAGLYATAWALLNREGSHGITWHAMTDEVDAGAIYHQTTFELGPEETSYSLNARCYEAAIESFGPLADALASGRAEPRAQPQAEKHYFARHKRPEAAGTLRWDRDAVALEAVVRALDFGPVENPLTLAKILAGDELVGVKSAARVDGSGAPGTILELGDELVVACGEGALAVRELTCLSGSPVALADWAARHGLHVGSILPRISEDEAARLTARHEDLCRHESFWTKRLAALVPLELPLVDPALLGEGGVRATFAVPEVAKELGSDAILTALLAYLARVCDAEQLDVAFGDPALRERIADAPRWFARHVPLRAHVAMDAGFDALASAVAAELERVRTRGSYACDAIARHPQLSANAQAIGGALARVTVELARSVADYTPPSNASLAIALGEDGEMVWCADARVFGSGAVAAMQRQFAIFLGGVAQSRETPIGAQPLLSEDERRRVVGDFNATAANFRRDVCVHELFEEQAARTPHAPAVCHLEQTLSYSELDARANQLAHRLAALGVGPDSLVAVSVERGADMLVATLGVMKAGGAYVPLDPTYPRDRLALMLEDSRAKVLVTQRDLAGRFPAHAGTTVLVSDPSDAPKTKPQTKVTPENLAYVIYTSGSTGKPKGVMVEHRNVVNFFAGMDERLGREGAPGSWLAVTSLSFDISVLELFWTLSRGFKVVLHSDKADDAAIARAHLPNQALPITMSLMYFASDEGENKASEKYKLLLDGARFADENGFSAVWTPERHFHAFGGLYPNPSVAAAALATITKNIQLRAASVVMPLHHPIRVAEEWALVDNLSGGRVGISFASGWQPNDFVIYKPERFKDRKQAMLDDLETVRKLWRGEALKLTSPLGKEIEVRTLPRPIQKELPFWLTAAGNPETFRAAGAIGANCLTHLLGQTIEEVGEKIRVYREARKAAGHEGPGQVTVMLHTFVGPDADEVRRLVREPMKAYLKSSVDLIKAAAWTFPTFKEKADKSGKTPAQIFEEQEMTPEELDAVLEHAFNRYYETSGLFGTPATCLKMIDRLKGIGVDDIGCLLDYGVPSAKVLEHLKYLNELKTLATPASQGPDYTLAAQVRRHGVTHLQCTPSQMSMILADEDARGALRGLSKVMIGGEAFPAALAAELRAATNGDILNMYGPTETTIWSSTERVAGDGSAVSLGEPIANTQLYVLDRRRELVPLGMAGELYIGGDGVTRGYFERAELTAERFVDDPFRKGGRLYRTGDLVRRREDGTLDFLGRMDFQVKIRGYRIELGEIEAQLCKGDGVRDAVVAAREDSPGDKRLVAYLVSEAGKAIDVEALKTSVRAELPDYMVPSAFVVLPNLPLTPNGKVDRKALPAPDKATARTTTAYVAPAEGIEEQIASVWTELLSVERVGLDDNFFDLGGHSLLTVQMQRRLKDVLARPLALTDLFRFPTIRSLAEFLGGDGTSKTMEKSKDRADARRAAMARRSEVRDRRPQRR